MIAVILASLLFIKYIFLDKTETYSIPVSSNSKQSLPPTSPPKPSVASCPFALPESSPSVAELSFTSSKHMLPADLRGTRGPMSKAVEKLVTDGVVIGVENGGACPALPAPATTTSGQDSPLTRSKSSSRMPVASRTPATTTLTSACPSLSVATQTDLESPVGRAVFTVGGRKDSTFNSLESECSEGSSSPPSMELPSSPRELEECVSILKSDVSVGRILC